jgi:hypothetical protein
VKWPARPGDEVKVVLPAIHRAGWVTVEDVEPASGELTVLTPDGVMTVTEREVAGWRPA